ncbi:hypothetical protein AMAG_16340 [Allomyces macrogynus ATCC 38327]|uniref:YIF1-domain-containing protein n=1 Tax=Allomyces macrogynus (strain ATCC 38327) TaxID=578462 RepID=A0A0L0TB22_ALLM3|nr:hypothetical protein AMAG_16340 [Allomyces macrogynus ATCC 38327]|eukprot:KNE71916.1 hypothetical protein AMAG_16340 [Allomyces macrogynus ATCC 38327]
MYRPVAPPTAAHPGSSATAAPPPLVHPVPVPAARAAANASPAPHAMHAGYAPSSGAPTPAPAGGGGPTPSYSPAPAPAPGYAPAAVAQNQYYAPRQQQPMQGYAGYQPAQPQGQPMQQQQAYWQQQPQRPATGQGFQPMPVPQGQYAGYAPATGRMASPMPPQQGQQQQGQQQQQQQPQAPTVPLFNPAAFAGLVTDPTAQIGMQLGSKAVLAGQEYVNQNINRYFNLPHLKYYFNVSNSYVQSKLQLVLFPFRQRHWHRRTVRLEHPPGYPTSATGATPASPVVSGALSPTPATTALAEYRPPREDVLAPDLYIPVMAFVTYVLLVGLDLGQRHAFHPQVLGLTASTAFFLVLCEVLLVKLGCYLFSVQAAVPVLDLVSYAGYKFVGIITTLLAAFLAPVLGTWPYWIALAYTSLALGFFSLRSMRYIVIPEAGSSTSTIHIPQRRRRINFLAGVVFLQMLTSWILVR